MLRRVLLSVSYSQVSTTELVPITSTTMINCLSTGSAGSRRVPSVETRCTEKRKTGIGSGNVFVFGSEDRNGHSKSAGIGNGNENSDIRGKFNAVPGGR